MKEIISIASMAIGIILIVYGVYCVISKIDWRKERKLTYKEKYGVVFYGIELYKDYKNKIQSYRNRQNELYEKYLIAQNKHIENKILLEYNWLEKEIDKNTKLMDDAKKVTQTKIQEMRDDEFIFYLKKLDIVTFEEILDYGKIKNDQEYILQRHTNRIRRI